MKTLPRSVSGAASATGFPPIDFTHAPGLTVTFQSPLKNHPLPSNGRWWRLVLFLLAPGRLLAVDFDPAILRSASVNSNNTIDANDVAVSGNHAYVAARFDGLKVFSIAPSGAPTLVPPGYDSAIATDEALGVAVSGDYAFLAFGNAGLSVIKISTPGAPQLWAQSLTGSGIGFGYDVAVSGNYAYLATLIGGLQVIRLDLAHQDINQRLTLVGTYDPPAHSALAVTVSGSIAYVSFGNAGMKIVDTSVPANPQPVGPGFDTDGTARGVAVSGHKACVADSGSGLTVLNIGDLTDPEPYGSFDTPGFAQGIAVNDAYAFVADGDAGLRVLDIRIPYAPVEVANYDTTNAISVTLSGTFAFVADGLGGLRVFNFSPSNSQRVGSYNTDGRAQGVAVLGNHAYLAEDFGDDAEESNIAGLKVIDISNPASPQQAGSAPVADGWGVALAGNFAYVADEFLGLVVMDVSNPGNPHQVLQYDLDATSGYARNVAISANHAYVGLDTVGLRLINLSLPVDQPVLLLASGDGGWDSALSGNYAYVTGGGLLRVFEISNPANPLFVGSCATPGGDVAVSGNYAYIGGLRVIDISNKSNPQPVGFFDTGEAAAKVAVSGNYAYVTGGNAGLHVIDISNKTSPQRVGGNGYFPAHGVTIAGDKVYVAAGYYGLVILDVFRPYQMGVMATTSAGTFSLQVSGPRNVPLQLQRSVDLIVWEDWLSVTPTDGAVQVSDSDFPTTAKRFYRMAH